MSNNAGDNSGGKISDESISKKSKGGVKKQSKSSSRITSAKRDIITASDVLDSVMA